MYGKLSDSTFYEVCEETEFENGKKIVEEWNNHWKDKMQRGLSVLKSQPSSQKTESNSVQEACAQGRVRTGMGGLPGQGPWEHEQRRMAFLCPQEAAPVVTRLFPQMATDLETKGYKLYPI